MLPDAICSPIEEGQWSVVTYGDKALVQFYDQIGTVIDIVNLPLLLESSLNDAEIKPDKILYYFLESETLPATLEQTDVETVKIAYNTHPLVIFGGAYSKANSLNLLQGQYKP